MASSGRDNTEDCHNNVRKSTVRLYTGEYQYEQKNWLHREEFYFQRYSELGPSVQWSTQGRRILRKDTMQLIREKSEVSEI